jgi:hypothetical protein
MLLDMKNPEKPPVEIVPPAMGGLYGTLSRAYPPLWSPTSEFILFEGQYKSEYPSKTRYHIVSVDGSILLPSTDGIWSHDGKYIRELVQTENYSSGEYSDEYMAAETDVLSKTDKKYTSDKLKINFTPDFTSVIRISPSGQTIAYAANKEVFVYDVVKKNTVSYGTFPENTTVSAILGFDFFWISPKD